MGTPITVCYLGANIDREDTIDDTFMDGDQVYRTPDAFNQSVGKHHAMFFTYLAYGREFPAHWVKRTWPEMQKQASRSPGSLRPWIRFKRTIICTGLRKWRQRVARRYSSGLRAR